MIDTIGCIGSFLLAMCGVPQVIKTFRTKSADDLSWFFIVMWLGGEAATFAYLIANNFATGNFQVPLYLNYGFNLLVVCLLLFGKAWYGRHIHEENNEF